MAKSPSSAKKGAARKPAAASADNDASVADTGVAASSDDSLPDKAAIEAMLLPVRRFMESPRHTRVREFLLRLAAHPPQVLLLEGGTVPERTAAVHYWALLLNCRGQARGADDSAASSQASLPLMPRLPGMEPPPSTEPLPPQSAAVPTVGTDASIPVYSTTDAAAGPCLACPECIRMVTHLHRDCFFLDGLAASIKIDDVRAVRAVLGEPPREARFRMVIFREAQALVEAAANALLKSFEEPRPATSFVMLAPQRERLLPTLVSRSTVLTLPWPAEEDLAARDALAPWEAALCSFAETGRGWFERTGSRGAVDAPLAHAVANMCRHALGARILGLQSGKEPAEGLERVFARLPEQRLRMLDEVLAECQDSLIYNVNPTLVLEWLATRLYLLLPR